MNATPVYTKWSRPAPKRRRRFRAVAGSEVPETQLYREIAGGYRYFMAQKMKRETLRNVR